MMMGSTEKCQEKNQNAVKYMVEQTVRVERGRGGEKEVAWGPWPTWHAKLYFRYNFEEIEVQNGIR